MVETCHSLGIYSQIQQEAVLLLADTRRGFMRSDLLRERLIKSLAQGGYSAIFLPKINSEVEALVEQQLLLRQVRRGQHEIGLNKLIWKITPRTIDLIREVTTSTTSSKLFASSSREVVEDAKEQLKKMRVSRRQVSDTAFEILVALFLRPAR